MPDLVWSSDQCAVACAVDLSNHLRTICMSVRASASLQPLLSRENQPVDVHLTIVTEPIDDEVEPHGVLMPSDRVLRCQVEIQETRRCEYRLKALTRGHFLSEALVNRCSA